MYFFHTPIHMMLLLQDLLGLMKLLLLLLLMMIKHRIKATAPLSRGRRKQRRPTGNGQTKSGVRLLLVG